MSRGKWIYKLHKCKEYTNLALQTYWIACKPCSTSFTANFVWYSHVTHMAHIVLWNMIGYYAINFVTLWRFPGMCSSITSSNRRVVCGDFLRIYRYAFTHIGVHKAPQWEIALLEIYWFTFLLIYFNAPHSWFLICLVKDSWRKLENTFVNSGRSSARSRMVTKCRHVAWCLDQLRIIPVPQRGPTWPAYFIPFVLQVFHIFSSKLF